MRLLTKRVGNGVAAVALATTMPVTASAAPPTSGTLAPLYAKMKQGFTTKDPGAWTGWRFDGALRPYPPGAQPPPQRSAVFVFPRGTRFDFTRVAKCTASDGEIARDGVGACPERSRFLSGTASVFAGTAGNIDARVYVFIAVRGAVVVFTTESGSVLRVFRATVRGNRVATTLPAISLPGGYEVSVLGMSLRAPRLGTRKHPALRTPGRCPRSGRWTFTYLPRYDPPNSVQRSTSSIRCRRDRG